jgi:hypothetical protein
MVRAMRPTVLHLILAAVLTTGVASAAIGQTKTTPAKAAAKTPVKKVAVKAPAKEIDPPPAPPEPYTSQDQVKTADDLKRESVKGAVTTPLRDLNVMKSEIPPVLMAALTDPYARPPAKWRCPQLAALIRPLDDALGPDIDRLPPGDENLMDRSKSTALGVGADLAAGAIPFRGVVRTISGAASHDRLVQSAIVAGNVRRGYLKGLGESKGCTPPATPSHEREGAAPAIEQRKGPIPKYPIRQSSGSQTSGGTPPASQPQSRP